jgi:hypothetical protein
MGFYFYGPYGLGFRASSARLSLSCHIDFLDFAAADLPALPLSGINVFLGRHGENPF